MAETILTNVLTSKITIEQLFNWLTTDNSKNTNFPEIIDNGCTRSEFISYFLNFLREQCESFSLLENPKKPQEKIIVKPLTKTFPIQTIIGHTGKKSHEKYFQEEQELIGSPVAPQEQQSIFQHGAAPIYQAPASVDSETRRGNSNNIISQDPRSWNVIPFHPVPQLSDQYPYNRPSRVSNPIYEQEFYHPTNPGPPFIHPNAGLNISSPGPYNCPPNVSGIPKYAEVSYNSASPGPSFPETNTGLNISSPGPCNCPPNVSGIPKYPEISYNSANPGPSFPQPFTGLNISSPPGEFDKSLTDMSTGSNSPEKSDSYVKNNSAVFNTSVVLSPVSPLYANISKSTPKGKSQCNPNAQDCSNNSINQSNTSTPKNISNSGQKAGQNRQSLCLGDFIKVESTGPKKSAKKYSKTQFGRNAQSSDSVTPVSGTKSKRRINPTRLDTPGNKESQGNDVFGVISRPSTANPKFIEAPSTDKSQEEASFNVERSLLKLERQRQPQNTSTTESRNVDQKFASNTQAALTNALSFSVDSVENIDELNILARVYSDILNHNLMINPTTELYFLVTLLTTQYKPSSRNKTWNVSTSTGESLETLKQDLGCAELPDEILSRNGDSMFYDDEKSVEKPITDDTKQSLMSNDSKDTSEVEIRRKGKFDFYFESPQNCIYFATKVLCDQHVLLSSLDRVTLKLLCENHQIATFQPSLQTFLNEIYRDKCSQTNRIRQCNSRSLQSNVCFQVDTDNRDMFPSMTAFNSFRKQRDLFYEILKDWEDHHLLPNWSFTRALNHKIKALLSAHNDVVNYCHFAKLFISQLLASSVQSGQSEDPMNDESLSFLKTLTNVNPEKLLQLKERLVTPMTSVDPVPKPMFPGVQQFYKQFIIHASIWNFYVILQTCLIHEIMELNETSIAESEVDGTDTKGDEMTKQNFTTCLSSLRLLAKFVSFTQSLPFKSMGSSSQFYQTQIQLRSSILPPLDLRGCLLDALVHKRLSLTVPWIVQYMAMLDHVTLRLPYYMKICEILYYIYRASNHCRIPNTDNSMSPQTSILMIFTIGWLFELPNFPRDFYNHWQLNFNKKKLQIFTCSYREQIENDNANSVNLNSSKEFLKYKSSLDNSDIIDDRALYECCPFLVVFKLLLISGNSTIGNNTVNRHITPVSSELSEPTFGVKYKNLQMQLEEAFFHGQPSSTRKTVDFISERVASNCVKYICYTLIPAVKQRVITEFMKNSEIDNDDNDDDDDGENGGEYNDEMPESPMKIQNDKKELQKAARERKQQELAVLIKENAKKECATIIPNMCQDRIIKSIDSLLADDAVPAVKETCLAVAKRTAIDRIEQWIDSHVVESLFLKNINDEINTIAKSCDPVEPRKDNSDTPLVTDIIGTIRGSMWEMLERGDRWVVLSVDTVLKILTNLHQILTERSDFAKYLEKNLYNISLEYCLFMAANRPDLLTEEIKQLFINIWKIDRIDSGKPKDLFARVISPRNIRMLTHNENMEGLKAISWMLTGVLNENLLKINALSDQCVALFRQEWPISILKQLSQCLKPVLSDYKCVNKHTKAIQILLDWVTETDEMDA